MKRLILLGVVAVLALPMVALADPGPHLVVGSMGDDVLIGGNGEDIILGFAGNDVLAGGRKHDVLRGGNGNDRLAAWAAQSGPDTLIGGGGRFDRCVGGPEDTFHPSCEVQIVRNSDGSPA